MTKIQNPNQIQMIYWKRKNLKKQKNQIIENNAFRFQFYFFSLKTKLKPESESESESELEESETASIPDGFDASFCAGGAPDCVLIHGSCHSVALVVFAGGALDAVSEGSWRRGSPMFCFSSGRSDLEEL